MIMTRRFVAALCTATIALAACGGSEESADTTPPTAAADNSSEPAASGITLVSAQDAAATIADAPDDLVILDVRTAEEFAEGHIEGATMIDFYSEDFAAQIAELDPDVPYVLYCRSGNRSGQTRSIMSELGFASVEDVDGGVISWQTAGLPLVAE